MVFQVFKVFRCSRVMDISENHKGDQGGGPKMAKISCGVKLLHQCGHLGCCVGEASNPGPAKTRQARRVEHDRVIADTAQDSVSTTRRRRQRLRPLPWLRDSDSDLDEPVQSQVRSQRSCPVTQVVASAMVPASSGTLSIAGLLEHGFPTSDTQHNQMLLFRRRTVGEVESTVPATPLPIVAAGMARSAATPVDSSGIEDNRDLGPGRVTRPVEGRDVRPRKDHQRGLVVETAPNVVDATTVDLSSSLHDSVVDALELDLAVDEEFDGEERNDEEAVAVPVGRGCCEWEWQATVPASQVDWCVHGRFATFQERA